MDRQQKIHNYLVNLLHWTQVMKKDWSIFRYQIASWIEKRELDMLEEELNKLELGITEVQKLPGDQPQLIEEIAKIKSRAEQLHGDWLSMAQMMNKGSQESLRSQPAATQDGRVSNSALIQPVPIGEHTLPPLPYSYDALEPYIEEEIMQLHHTEHHQSYVDGLNKAERKMAEARRTGDYDLLRHWEREAAFHGAGHYLHTIFWSIMKPGGGGAPVGELARQIKKDFGSFEDFKEHFSKAAEEVEGVGWAILVWAPRAHRLEILQAEKHQLLSQWDVIPILVLDVWEHAYYLQYKADKEEYIKNWWNVVNWEHANYRFIEAQKLRWQPY